MRRRWLTTTRGVVITVVVVAALLRLWSLGSAPLFITIDGDGYLRWGQELLETGRASIPPFRTPGYPIFLAMVFAVWGVGSFGVLIAQHALGVAGAGLLAWTGCRMAGARWGLVAGLLFAIDPVQLAMAHYALSEALQTALLILAFALVLGTDCRWPKLIALGFTVGALILVKPTFQLVLPFFVLAVACTGVSLRQRLARPLIVGATAVLTVLPWVVHTHRHYGSWRVAESTSAFLWLGVGHAGLLKTDYPLAPVWKAEYDRIVGTHPRDSTMHDFLMEIGGMRPGNARILGDWAAESVRERPRDYAAAAALAMAWQFDIFPSWGYIAYNETSWYVRRLTTFEVRPGRKWQNDLTSGSTPWIDSFGSMQRPGSGTWIYGLWSRLAQPSLLRLPLAACILAAMVWAAWQRRFALPLLLVGMFAFMAAHAVLLQYSSRYSMPIWAIWALGPAMLAHFWYGRPAQRLPVVVALSRPGSSPRPALPEPADTRA